MVKLNSVESALKYPIDLIAEHASAIEFDYDKKSISIRVLEDEGCLISAFLVDMGQADPTLAAQSYKMVFTTMAATGMTEVAKIIFDGVSMKSHRLVGFHYAGTDPVEHEIGLWFDTVVIEADAIR